MLVGAHDGAVNRDISKSASLNALKGSPKPFATPAIETLVDCASSQLLGQNAPMCLSAPARTASTNKRLSAPSARGLLLCPVTAENRSAHHLVPVDPSVLTSMQPESWMYSQQKRSECKHRLGLILRPTWFLAHHGSLRCFGPLMSAVARHHCEIIIRFDRGTIHDDRPDWMPDQLIRLFP